MTRIIFSTVLTITFSLFGVIASAQDNAVPLEKQVQGTWLPVSQERPPLEITSNSISQGFWGMNSVEFKPLTDQIVGIIESGFKGQSEIILIPDDDGTALAVFNQSNNKNEMYYKVPKLPHEINNSVENKKILLSSIQGKWKADDSNYPNIEIGPNWLLIGNTKEKNVTFKPQSKSIVSTERNGIKLDHFFRIHDNATKLFAFSVTDSDKRIEYSKIK